MRSMTGFGKGEALTPDGKILFRAEVSSVNRKQLELKLNLPREMTFCEFEVRRLTNGMISRGALTMRVEMVFQDGHDPAPGINTPALVSLVRQLSAVRSECHLAGEVQVEQLLALPGILEGSGVDYEDPSLLETLKKACTSALESLIRMRESEGENLKESLEKQLAFLSESVDRIEPMVKKLPQMQYEKLLKRIAEYNLGADQTDERLLRELVVFSDRSDVTEEITRLRSHFVHLASFLNERREALGRNMDFLMQEIFREINTLGNKAPLPEVSALIVRMKTEVEKIREQVQNIE